MTIAVYVQMMSLQSCKLCNNSSRGKVTIYPVLTELVFAPVTILMVKIVCELAAFYL